MTMHPVLGILLGTICTGGTSICLGASLLRRLTVPLDRIEHLALALVVGSACLSEINFFLCSAGLARQGVFLAVAVLSLAAALAPGSWKKHPPFPAFPILWKWFFAILFTSFGVVYLVNAIAPEMSPDGSAYHLPIVIRYLQAHGFTRDTQNFYANLSQGIGLLFLPAVSLGRNSAASMVQFLFLLDLPLMMVCYGRRFGFPLPALAAAFLVFASPLFGWDGTSAYVDVATAAILFALFYLLQIWEMEEHSGLLIPIGILAGFSYAAKYSAAIAIPYALGFVAWKLWRGGKPLLRPVLTVCALIALFVAPWMVKNAILAGNPLAPFGNHLFPNPYVHVSFEQEYRFNLWHYRLTSWWSAPWELAVKGERLQGSFGPVFLLMPLALFSVRWRSGRRLLLAGAIFALPWSFNVGTRFLMPALPPLALALTLALRNPPALLPAIAVLHAILSWYAAPFDYFDAYAPRLAAFPLRAALRLQTEDEYLEQHSSGYRIDRMIERNVPAGAKVFSFEQIPEAWTTRPILVRYMAAENEVLGDILRAPLDPSASPSCGWAFRFASLELQRVRLVQTGQPAGEMWSVSEFELYSRGKRVLPKTGWQWEANPNPWDAPLAFDDRPVTRWRSWENAVPGMFLEIDLGGPELIDEVRLQTTPDAHRSRVEIRGMDARGEWHTLSTELSPLVPEVRNDLRRQAVQALMARGIRYLLISPGAFGANDFYDHPDAWGIQEISRSDGRRLYRLSGTAAPVNRSLSADHSAVSPGVYDDADPRIDLQAAWTHDPQFLEADRHTLTYSNIPGASAALTFTGDAITYVYTKASNRGIAEIWIDGVSRGQLDLYSANTIWRQRTTYAGLGAGMHTLEIRVTGARNPKAVNCFVDLDAFIVN